MSSRLAPLFALVATGAGAAEQPLWEVGLGIGDIDFPAYRGSRERQNFALPAPYLVYRGDFLKADRSGVRGVFVDSDRFEINVSASASPPIDSDDIDLRRGMPDLHPTIEIGPSLDLALWQGGRYALELRLPARYAVTVESDPHAAGWVATPHLNLDIADAFAPGWNLGVLSGPVYGSRQQHAYFYAVAPRDATIARPAYRAAGGYGGWQTLAAVSKRYPRYWIGAFARYDVLDGAVFTDSPLVTDDRYVAAGIAVAWIIDQSETTVHTDE